MANYHKGAVFMLAEKLFKMASQLLVLVLMARVLPPHELGQLMYCFALASIFLFLNQLGLDTLLVKKFIDQSRKKVSLLWHAFTARMLAAVLCVVLVNLLGLWLVEAQYRQVLLLISLYHLFLPFSTFEWFYQAEGRSDNAAIGLIIGQIAGLLIRLYAVFYQPDLLIFAAAYVVEAAITAVVYLSMTKRDQLQNPGKLSFQRMEALTKEAIPLMISGAVILLYMKIDQVMLGYLASEAEVAYYVAATRLSEAWYFVGLTLVTVYFPQFIKLKTELGASNYLDVLAFKTRKLIATLVCFCVVICFFSDRIIEILYGNSYSSSVTILSLTIWAVPLVVFGSIVSRLYIYENLSGIILKRSIVGLIVAALLNYTFIEEYGAIACAVSMLAAQFFTSILFPAFDDCHQVKLFFKKLLFIRV